MNLEAASRYFQKRARELRRACADGTPWVFLSASAYLEYLSKLTGPVGYKNFIKVYLSQVRPLYRDFVYRNGKQDLDVQMYHILRCGIVHSFSLIPDRQARVANGRERSIILCHAKERDKKKWSHLMQYRTRKIPDAALFVAEDFVDDIGKVTKLIFEKAKTDKQLGDNIERWLGNYPPITGGF